MMRNKAAYTAEYLNDGHLSIPEEIVNMFTLESGGRVRVTIEASMFNKTRFLNLFGIWKQKNIEEVNVFKDIYEERNKFGRGEIKL
jgi:hypothetical protein